MIRGTVIFRCPKCGKIFLGPDVEYNATTFSHPLKCPRCRTLSAPLFKDRLYRTLGILKQEQINQEIQTHGHELS